MIECINQYIKCSILSIWQTLYVSHLILPFHWIIRFGVWFKIYNAFIWKREKRHFIHFCLFIYISEIHKCIVILFKFHWMHLNALEFFGLNSFKCPCLNWTVDEFAIYNWQLSGIKSIWRFPLWFSIPRNLKTKSIYKTTTKKNGNNSIVVMVRLKSLQINVWIVTNSLTINRNKNINPFKVFKKSLTLANTNFQVVLLWTWQ